MSYAIGVSAFSSVIPTVSRHAGVPTIDIQLTPAGDFKPSDGREMTVAQWRINRDIAARIIERNARRVNRAVLDYEHQTLNAETNGQPAPAAGWFASVEWREGSGLWARVELTERAALHIAAKEYRYVSPVFRYDPTTGEVLEILMAAITNNPAIDGMAPLELMAAASFVFRQENQSVNNHPSGLTADELAVCRSTGIDPAEFAASKQSSNLATHGLTADELAVCRSTGTDPADFAASKQSSNRATHGLTADELAVCRSTGTDPADFAATKAGPTTSQLTEEERAVCRATGVRESVFLAARQNQAR